MRTFYLILNICLALLALLLLVLNISFKPHAPDKILSSAPALTEAVPAAGRKLKGGREEIPDVAMLWENNLFSQFRSGEGGPLLGSAKPTGLELIGICSFGDISGAIILDKQTPGMTPSMPGRLRGRTSMASATSTAGGPKFYKLGDQLENGFTLSEITPDSVTLSRGREQISLKLEFEGDSSIQRNAAAAEAAAAAAAAKIEQRPRGVQQEVPEAPDAPPVPGAPGNPATPAPGNPVPPPARVVSETPAVSGTAVTVNPAAQPGSVVQGARSRVPPSSFRRQRQATDANVAPADPGAP